MHEYLLFTSNFNECVIYLKNQLACIVNLSHLIESKTKLSIF